MDLDDVFIVSVGKVGMLSADASAVDVLIEGWADVVAVAAVVDVVDEDAAFGAVVGGGVGFGVGELVVGGAEEEEHAEAVIRVGVVELELDVAFDAAAAIVALDVVAAGGDRGGRVGGQAGHGEIGEQEVFNGAAVVVGAAVAALDGGGDGYLGAAGGFEAIAVDDASAQGVGYRLEEDIGGRILFADLAEVLAARPEAGGVVDAEVVLAVVSNGADCSGRGGDGRQAGEYVIFASAVIGKDGFAIFILIGERKGGFDVAGIAGVGGEAYRLAEGQVDVEAGEVPGVFLEHEHGGGLDAEAAEQHWALHKRASAKVADTRIDQEVISVGRDDHVAGDVGYRTAVEGEAVAAVGIVEAANLGADGVDEAAAAASDRAGDGVVIEEGAVCAIGDTPVNAGGELIGVDLLIEGELEGEGGDVAIGAVAAVVVVDKVIAVAIDDVERDHAGELGDLGVEGEAEVGLVGGVGQRQPVGIDARRVAVLVEQQRRRLRRRRARISARAGVAAEEDR